MIIYSYSAFFMLATSSTMMINKAKEIKRYKK